ncbi:MAG: hypothetical protein ACLP9L_22535 [Thermoguttaceae bacterium]
MKSAPGPPHNTYLHYAVIYRQSPVGLPMPGVLKNAKNSSWNEEFNRTLQDIAWETVTHYPHAGVKVGATSSMPKASSVADVVPASYSVAQGMLIAGTTEQLPPRTVWEKDSGKPATCGTLCLRTRDEAVAP